MESITHCISIKEPYASMIAAREKTLEWRSRKLIARPPETIAIATSKKGAGRFLPGGHIVGIARISAIVPFLNTEDFYNRMGAPELWREFNANKNNAFTRGFSGLDGYAYMISGFAACEPVPVRGNVGLYKVPDGFAPAYADRPAQLVEWWSAAGARAWIEGAADNGERAFMDAMTTYGAGWRIDD